MFSFDEFSGLVSRPSVLSITFFQCGCARYGHGRLYNSAGGLESAGNGLYPIQDPLPIENPVTMLLVCSVFCLHVTYLYMLNSRINHLNLNLNLVCNALIIIYF